MRRTIFLSVSIVLAMILGFALGVPAAQAAPVGGLSYNLGARGFAFSAGAGVGFVQRDVHVIENDQLVDESSSSRFLIKVDVAPAYFIDIYALGGAADFQMDDADFRGALTGAWGGGARLMLLPYSLKTDLNVTLDAQYVGFTAEDHDVKAKSDESQVALIIAYKLRGIVPYGGFKYNPVKVQFAGDDNDLTGDQEAGVFIGTDYFITPNVFFTGELSIFSETSLFLMVGYNMPSIH